MDTATSVSLQAAVEHLRAADPVLAALINRYGPPRPSPHREYYRELVESIISQQLSVKAADSILRRFVGLFGNTFPSPQQILTKDIEELRSAGLSYQKAGYIKDLATKVVQQEVKFDQLDTLTNDEIIAELTAIKGVGVWTVHMFLLFCMGRLDILPSGDLGIKNGIQKAYNLTKRPSETEIIELSNKHGWHPYESVASWYMWQSLDNKPTVGSSTPAD